MHYQRYKNFIREKRIYCGKNYLEVDIIQCREPVKGKRVKGHKSRRAQVNLNESNSKRYFVQLGKANFRAGDLHVTCTYDNDHLPGTLTEALREVGKYIRRLQYHMRKKGLELKYMLVTEFTPEGEPEEDKAVRIHHHIIMNAGLDRDFVEGLWSADPMKGKKKRGYQKQLGFCNADRLQENENGIEGLCKYVQKRKDGCKRWSTSQNLRKPEVQQNDSKYSRKKVMELHKAPEDKNYWRSEFPGFEPSEIEWKFNEFTGWAVYVKLRRIDKIKEDREPVKRRKRRRKNGCKDKKSGQV